MNQLLNILSNIMEISEAMSQPQRTVTVTETTTTSYGGHRHTHINEEVHIFNSRPRFDFAPLYAKYKGLERHVELQRPEYRGRIAADTRIENGFHRTEVTIIQAFDDIGRCIMATEIRHTDETVAFYSAKTMVKTTDRFGRVIGETKIESSKDVFGTLKVVVSRR